MHFNRKGGIMRKCDACGKVYAEGKDVFCPHCGAIGQKQCNHGASFDSSKWDRGEIYKNSNTYKQGAEPHAQRTSSAYNTNNKKAADLSGGQFGSDYNAPNTVVRNIIETVTKKATESKKDEKKFVKIIGAIVALISVFNVILSDVDSSDVFSDSFFEDTSTDYINYPVDVLAGEVYIEPFEDWDGTWFFDMYFDTLYLYSDEAELSTEVCDKLSGDEYIYIDGLIYTMPDKVMSIDSFNNIIDEEGSYVISDAQSTDAHTIQYWFNAGDIIYCDLLTFVFDDGSAVDLILPFDAFSCDENGKVTYYTCNENEAEETVSFEETEPGAVLEGFDCVLEF